MSVNYKRMAYQGWPTFSALPRRLRRMPPLPKPADTPDLGSGEGMGCTLAEFPRSLRTPIPVKRHTHSIVLALAVVASPLVATPANAGFTDGNELHSHCGDKSGYLQGYCDGYIGGVADSIEQEQLCLPDTVKFGQLRDVVLIFLRDHPQDRHFSASSLVIAAIKQAFCK